MSIIGPIVQGTGPPAPHPQTQARSPRPAVVRALVVALAMLALSPLLVMSSARPALANDYLYLNEESWSRTDSAGNGYTLTARIAIETDGSGNGRLRFRLQCFRTDADTGQRTVNSCDFHFTDGANAYWCNSQPPTRPPDYTPPATCVTRHLDDASGSDVYWFGSWHTMGHQVELVHVHGFSAVFNAGAGPAGANHSILSQNAIINLANQQAANGYAEWSTNCNYYSPYFGLGCQEWCADFLRFVWKIAGVAFTNDINSLAASLVTVYGARHPGSWHAGSSLTGIQPGDAVVYGYNDGIDNDHVAIYVGGGMAVSGNYNNAVTKHSVTYRTPSGYTEALI